MDKKTVDRMGEIVQGVPVYVSFKGQPAFNAGIRQGDIIIAVNGMKTPTADEYIEAAKLDTDEKRVIQVWRNGEELTFELVLKKRGQPSAQEILGMMAEEGADEFLLGKEKESGELN